LCVFSRLLTAPEDQLI